MSGVVDLPIFDAGRRSANYKIAKAQREELLISYQKAINGAFHERLRCIGWLSEEQRAQPSARHSSPKRLRDQSRLANRRYVGGVSSYLEVLDTERQRPYPPTSSFAQGAAGCIDFARTTLQRALGGGWQ